MNKFIFFALAALVAVAAAAPTGNDIEDEASQMAFFDSDDAETKGLSADKQIFEDFCLQTRDEVKKYLKGVTNSGAAKLFNLMVDTASDVSSSIGSANAQAVEEGSKMVEGDARQMKSAVTGVVQAIGASGRAKVMEIYTAVKEQMNKDTIQGLANDVCMHVSMKMKPSIDSSFNAYKKILKNNQANAQMADVIAKTRLENLGCLTTSRLTKVATGCNMIRTLAPSIMDFMGLSL